MIDLSASAHSASARLPRRPSADWNAEDATEEAPFKTLTRQEAQALRGTIPTTSPWKVIGAQAVVGVVCSALLWALTQRTDLAASALYGAATAVLPGAVLARGMTRRTSSNPAAAAIGFMFWEMVKIALAVAMLMAAVRVVPGLSWPALLGVLVVCMKVSWLAMLWQRRPAVKTPVTAPQQKPTEKV